MDVSATQESLLEDHLLLSIYTDVQTIVYKTQKTTYSHVEWSFPNLKDNILLL